MLLSSLLYDAHDHQLKTESELDSVVKALNIFSFIVCADGTYGYNCVKNCSGQCLINSSCNKQTGHCEMGCNSGYTDNKCSLGTNTKYKLLF